MSFVYGDARPLSSGYDRRWPGRIRAKRGQDMTKRLFGRTGTAARLPMEALALSLAGTELPGTEQHTGTTTPAPSPTPSIDFRLPDTRDGRALIGRGHV